MAEEKVEKKVAPKRATSTKNKDGFEKGKAVSNEDYFAFMAKARLKK